VVLAMAERGGLLNVARNVYMHKIAIGGEYPAGTVHIDWTATENVNALARTKGVPISEITAIVLDRPRHAGLIEELRTAGVAVKLISDGDIAGVIHAVNTEDTGIDIYLGSGGAPEGVLAAAALRCIGGQMQGKLILDTAAKRERAVAMGIQDPNRIYDVTELASGDVLVAATGDRRNPPRRHPPTAQLGPDFHNRHALLEPDHPLDQGAPRALRERRGG
jgi:fructose-1,6-bisphosphatase II / sedoheptulose-1,7-bisphosphatase